MHRNKICLWSFLSVILIFICANCGTFKKENTYSKNGLTVTYRSINRFGRGIGNYRIKHPLKISAKWIKNHLLALWHRKILSYGKANPIFSFDEIETLSPLFAKALGKVGPGKYLHFDFNSSKGITSGDIFSSTNKVHWRLLTINGIAYSNDPLKLRKPTWKMVRTHGQTFHIVPTDISQKYQENWILANIKPQKIKRRFPSR